MESVTVPFKAVAPIALMGLLASPPAGADGIDGDDFSVYAGLVSDYVFRGYSQSDENPALQLGVDFEHESGLFAGIWASSVEFPSRGSFDDPRDVEVDVYAGYGVELGRDWALSGSVVRYEYPGADAVVDWDYTELVLALHHGAAALTVNYSDSSLGSRRKRLAYELTGSWSLPLQLELATGLGFYDLDGPFLKDYVYWHAQLARPLRRLTFTLGYFDTDGRAEDVWGELAEARLVAGVTLRIH